jgi:hypothetical protein
MICVGKIALKSPWPSPKAKENSPNGPCKSATARLLFPFLLLSLCFSLSLAGSKTNDDLEQEKDVAEDGGSFRGKSRRAASTAEAASKTREKEATANAGAKAGDKRVKANAALAVVGSTSAGKNKNVVRPSENITSVVERHGLHQEARARAGSTVGVESPLASSKRSSKNSPGRDKRGPCTPPNSPFSSPSLWRKAQKAQIINKFMSLANSPNLRRKNNTGNASSSGNAALLQKKQAIQKLTMSRPTSDEERLQQQEQPRSAPIPATSKLIPRRDFVAGLASSSSSRRSMSVKGARFSQGMQRRSVKEVKRSRSKERVLEFLSKNRTAHEMAARGRMCKKTTFVRAKVSYNCGSRRRSYFENSQTLQSALSH